MLHEQNLKSTTLLCVYLMALLRPIQGSERVPDQELAQVLVLVP
jgi:hypothetical protein